MPDPKTYKQHFENKHPKNEMPEELKAVSWMFKLIFINYFVYKLMKYLN